jgi:hypothetical protein
VIVKKCLCGRSLSAHNRSGVCMECQRRSRSNEELIQRTCLRCDRKFGAWSRFERICQDCKRSAEFKEQREPMRTIVRQNSAGFPIRG